MNMRPFQIIMLTVFVILAIAGLYLFATYKGFGGGTPVGVVTIWGTLPASAVQSAIDSVRQGNQQFDKVTYIERPASTFDSDLSSALASGTGPNLVIIEQEQLVNDESELAVIPFSSIPQRTFLDTYLPIDALYLTSTGTYGVPLVVDPLVLYYNRALLGNANVPQPPTSWEAVVGLAPTLTQKTSAGAVSKSAIALGTYGNIPDARAIVSLLFLQSGNAISQLSSLGLRSALLAQGQTSSTGTLPAESALSFYTQFADPAKLVYSWNDSFPDARQAFIAGDSAMYVGFASERALIAASNPNLDFDMAAIPEPQTASTHVDYGLAYAFALPRTAANAAGALKAAESLAASAEARTIALPLGMAPATRSALTPAASDVYAPVYYPMALISEGWLSPAPSATDSIFAGMINGIVSGRETVHDALVAADQALNAAL